MTWPRRQQRERDLDEEIHAHLSLAAQDRIRNGESPEHASIAARREFGNTTLIKEIAALFARFLPARRASRIDLMTALRQE